mgnify:CR=1 FL=1
MYQPRRVSDVNATLEPEGNAAAFRSAPRRSVRTRSQLMRTRVAPAAVSVALLATSGASLSEVWGEVQRAAGAARRTAAAVALALAGALGALATTAPPAVAHQPIQPAAVMRTTAMAAAVTTSR